MVYAQRAQRVGCSTCCDNAEGEATSLVKVLAGDCQGGHVDQTAAQACRKTRGKTEETHYRELGWKVENLLFRFKKLETHKSFVVFS